MGNQKFRWGHNFKISVIHLIGKIEEADIGAWSSENSLDRLNRFGNLQNIDAI